MVDTENYSVIPLRDMVVFPNMVVPLFVGRSKSIQALEKAVDGDGHLFLVAQQDGSSDTPELDELYRVGVISNVLQVLKLPDGTVKALIEGVSRAKVNCYNENDEYIDAEVTKLVDKAGDSDEMEALKRTVLNCFKRYVKLNKKIPSDILDNLKDIDDPSKIVDIIAAHISLKIAEKQLILEDESLHSRLNKLLVFIESEIAVLSTEKEIRSRVRLQMEKNQKEYYLNEQMKAIQKELGDDDEEDDLKIFEKKIADKKLSKEAKSKALSEVKKLKSMSPMSAEVTVIKNYLDWLLNIPWEDETELKNDITKAQKILDNDHYGLEKVKERIIEYLAVQQRTNSLKSQILCLVGPPGVGKTSLARSIAQATGRNFARISLGGLRDEAEIRGHRRTYIGAMPGKIVQSMKKAKSSNPLFLLDEIDKMGSDSRGDPASALLEVLDIEQNPTFNDHYLEVDYDLSKVMFITTANTTNMPRPLLDRMEIIRISGYTEEEKVNIARKHLIPKIIKDHGVNGKDEWTISAAALKQLIAAYTRESGVRNLERELAKLVRKALTKIIKKDAESVKILPSNLAEYAGIERFEHNVVEKDDHIGVTIGLAYTEVGGDLLPIEAVLIPGGKGVITLTGNLGDVMQESARAAWSYVRSRSYDFGIKSDIYLKNDLHIHVPEGATPKDGPSAGAAMCTTIISALTGIAVRKDIAMTGEFSLRGQVLPIGGLKEKLLAALRGGIKTALIPVKNVKDMEEIPDVVKKNIEIIPVSTIDEVVLKALTTRPIPLRWENSDEKLLENSPDIKEQEVLAH